MSHDRGCPCGRESYEYEDCKEASCFKRTAKMRDALVFVGRFQPFHNGHKAVIDAALKQAKEVVVVVGSSFQARNIRNPFTFEERKAMIEACFTDPKYFTYAGAQGRIKTPRVKVVPVSDYPYDDNKWVNAIQRIVDETVPHARDVGLIGHSKDSTSYYLNIFPRWKNHVEVPNIAGINATDIRKTILTPMDYTDFEELGYVMPEESLSLVAGILGKPELQVVRAEYAMVKKYKEAWKAAPFPPTFMTVDAVVVQSGHVLLVKRGDMPGKGLWALPGGFLNQDETMLDGAIRELKEETKIKVPVPVLKGSIKESKTFDAPNRSARGRTITQAFLIDLGVGELPKVKGSDDAEEAFWVPFNQVKQEKMFEDHFHIIDNFINIG
jgi:bifunctional NMN adenylyltransferase/nudix hydrolase